MAIVSGRVSRISLLSETQGCLMSVPTYVSQGSSTLAPEARGCLMSVPSIMCVSLGDAFTTPFYEAVKTETYERYSKGKND